MELKIKEIQENTMSNKPIIERMHNYYSPNRLDYKKKYNKVLATLEKTNKLNREISFMDAIKLHEEGKATKCIYEGLTSFYSINAFGYLRDQYGKVMTTEEMLEGTWYGR